MQFRSLTQLIALAVLLLATAGVRAEAPAFEQGVAAGGELKYVQGVPVLFLSGTPEEIGRQQGLLVGEQAQQMAALPRALLGFRGGGRLWPLVTQVGNLMLRRAPERYREELESLAQTNQCSSDQRDALVVGNVLAELRRFDACAVLIVDDEKSEIDGPLFGRNFDFPAFGLLDRYSLLAVYRPEGRHAFASVTFPASLGVCSGMNEHGLAVACLDSGPARDGSPMFNPSGEPMLLTFRRVLEECTTVNEAEKLLKEIRHTTWFNLAVCDEQTAAVFEITSRRVERRGPEGALLACTNHFRTDELARPAACQRYARLAELQQQSQPFTVADVAGAMHEVNQGGLTIQTMLFEPRSRRLHLSLGEAPASAHPLTTFDLKTLFAHRPAAD